MVKLKLEIKAELENLTDFEPSEAVDAFIPSFKVQCTSCREIHPSWITVDPTDDNEMPGSRGTANFVWKCDFCKKGASASIDTTFKRQPLTAEAADSHKWATILLCECRGCEFVEFEPNATRWKAKGTDSATVFDEIELQDWSDYDEKAGLPVGITEVETRITRA